MTRLAESTVVVVGIGGVGSWAVEALARSGVGDICLVDEDVVAESNINRQLHALEATLGANKVDVMRERIAQINPLTRVRTFDLFLTADNCQTILDQCGPNAVIDAIDAPRAKAALIAACRDRNIALVVSGAAGGRDDPLQLKSDDLALTKGDPLLANVRSRLRRDYGFSRQTGQPFHVPVVISSQPQLGSRPQQSSGTINGAPLNCAGYGSIVTVTASMGMALAGICIKQLLQQSPKKANV